MGRQCWRAVQARVRVSILSSSLPEMSATPASINVAHKRVSLQAHPDRNPPVNGSINVDLTLDPTFLRLTYHAHLDAIQVCLPEQDARQEGGQKDGQRRDGLWQQTCCEIFIAAQGQRGYLEFNFAPNGDWACYAFETYRQMITPPQLPAPPSIACQITDDGFCLIALVDRNILPTAPAWDLGVSAVIEDIAGSKTYWALQHSGPQPDFHLRNNFQLCLP